MPSPFRPPGASDPESAGPRRPLPPDYQSRATRLRLLMLVGSLALVAMVASRVSDPQFWSLLGFEQRPIAGGPPLTADEIADESVNTQLAPQATEEDEVGVLSGADRRTASPPPTPVDPAEPPERWGVDPGEAEAERVAATRDAWRSLLADLPGDDQLLFYAALDARRAQRQLPAADHSAWERLLDRGGQSWKAYTQRAAESLEQLPEDSRQTWESRLAWLAQRWSDHWRPQLQTWVLAAPATATPAATDAGKTDTAQAESGTAVPPTDLGLIDQLLRQLDDVTASAIRDNTMARPAEKAVWFRWLSRLRDLPPDELRAQSLGPTGYLPLFKQPRDYRGKVVTVRGVVHLAYHVEAPPNRTDIPGYYLFWLRPAGGPNSPIVVYALETPPGFPEIRDKYVDGDMTRLNEEVEFTGYFFKRWAYQTAQDIQVAPLVLARSPQWTPPPPHADDGPSALKIALLVGVAAVIGVGLAWLALRRNPLPRRRVDG